MAGSIGHLTFLICVSGEHTCCQAILELAFGRARVNAGAPLHMRKHLLLSQSTKRCVLGATPSSIHWDERLVRAPEGFGIAPLP